MEFSALERKFEPKVRGRDRQSAKRSVNVRSMSPALTSPAFDLDSRLRADTLPVGDLELSTILLLNDARFPWFVLVPRVAGASEVTDLSGDEAAQLMREIRIATGVMLALAHPDKVNVGALGNIVTQLHVHVVGRFRSDPAWPGPVWGHGTRTPYPDHAAAALIDRAAQLFMAA